MTLEFAKERAKGIAEAEQVDLMLCERLGNDPGYCLVMGLDDSILHYAPVSRPLRLVEYFCGSPAEGITLFTGERLKTWIRANKGDEFAISLVLAWSTLRNNKVRAFVLSLKSAQGTTTCPLCGTSKLHYAASFDARAKIHHVHARCVGGCCHFSE